MTEAMPGIVQIEKGPAPARELVVELVVVKDPPITTCRKAGLAVLHVVELPARLTAAPETLSVTGPGLNLQDPPAPGKYWKTAPEVVFCVQVTGALLVCVDT